jgi:hypothetical protein
LMLPSKYPRFPFYCSFLFAPWFLWMTELAKLAPHVRSLVMFPQHLATSGQHTVRTVITDLTVTQFRFQTSPFLFIRRINICFIPLPPLADCCSGYLINS